MTEPFPDWPTPLKRFIDSAHLHALGQLTFVYNLLEEAFGYLFVRYYPTSREFAVNRYLNLNNRKRIHLLRELVQTSENDISRTFASCLRVVIVGRCPPGSGEYSMQNELVAMLSIADQTHPSSRTVVG
jgi:hypothetical protein